MGKIKGISFDMYRTLLDTRDFHEQAVREILATSQSNSVDPDKFHHRWDEIYDDVYMALEDNDFMLLYDVSIESLRQVMHEFGVKGDPKAGVDMWIGKYENADLYPEVIEVLDKLSQKYPIMITSNVDDNDAGYAMLRGKNLPIIGVVTSESSRSYKPNKKIFDDALSMLGCNPDEVIHIGDSQRADILGGKKAGMVTVWLDRKCYGKINEGIPEPDYTISDLRELIDIDHLK